MQKNINEYFEEIKLKTSEKWEEMLKKLNQEINDKRVIQTDSFLC